MALVAADIPFELTIQLVDRHNNTVSRRYQMQATDYATAVTDAASIVGGLQLITDAAIKGYTINTVMVEDALALPGAGTSTVYEDALITVRLDTDPTKSGNFAIPAPKADIFVADGAGTNAINLGDTNLIAWHAKYSGVAGTLYLSDGETSTAANKMLAGAHRWRKTIKRQ